MMAPKGGVTISQLDNPSDDRNEHYSASKAGNYLLASEFHRRRGIVEGVLHLTQNPGSLKTNIWWTTPKRYYLPYWPIFSWPIFSRPIDGAYTNLWAAFSVDITMEDGVRYGMPFGRWHPGQREDILLGLKEKKDGGTGEAKEFWDWCERKTKPFLLKA